MSKSSSKVNFLRAGRADAVAFVRGAGVVIVVVVVVVVVGAEIGDGDGFVVLRCEAVEGEMVSGFCIMGGSLRSGGTLRRVD